MSDPVLRYRVDEGVATLTLDRPDKRNALNDELIEALDGALRRAADDADARVVVLRGAGKDFCSGGDLSQLERAAEAGAEASLADATRMGELFVAMRRHPQPLVAAVHGRALAGGCGLATACDLILAHEDAEFGYPEVRLGFVPAMVLAILRRKVPEGRAFELVTTGARLGADEAERIHLVNRVLPDEGFRTGVARYARDLAERPAAAVSLCKRLLYGLDGTGFEEGIARGAEVNALARMTESAREGIRRFLEKRD